MKRAELDHLVYATPDLEATIGELEQVTGVRAMPGGCHPSEGTRNALIGLGPDRYLEVVGPDSAQPGPGRPRWFGIDALTGPRLAGWAARATDLEGIRRRADRAGVALGPVMSGSRRQPDGALLSWRFTDPHALADGGVIPFFIDWGSSPHPARGASGKVSLLELRGEHPDPEGMRRALEALGLDLAVSTGEQAALVATLMTPKGRVELR
jgi:Glyoxalase-like domain